MQDRLDVDSVEDIDAVAEALRISKRHRLSAEVMLQALRIIQSQPELTIPIALDIAMGEWDL